MMSDRGNYVLQTAMTNNYTFQSASFSQDMRYRYMLTRRWTTQANPKLCMFIMLNPSTTDGYTDDATIRRCVGFGKTWGYDGIVIFNVYGFIATDPKDLPKDDSRYGEDNYMLIEEMCKHSEVIVLAYGNNARKDDLHKLFANLYPFEKKVRAIDVSKQGMPKHPLYLSGSSKLKPIRLNIGFNTVSILETST